MRNFVFFFFTIFLYFISGLLLTLHFKINVEIRCLLLSFLCSEVANAATKMAHGVCIRFRNKTL